MKENFKIEEYNLLTLQIIITAIYIGSLVLSILLTYNDQQKSINNKGIFSNKFETNLSIFNRILVIILTLGFLYINYYTKNIAIKKGTKEIWPFDFQIISSQLSLLATIIVLYVVLESSDNRYTIVSGVENPSL